MTIQPGERIFLDSNILLAATDRSRPMHQAAQALISRAGSAGWHLHISGQIVREYLVVATRPVSANGLGMAPADAMANIDQLLTRMNVLDENETVSRELRTLVAACEVTGKHIHEAGIAATMKAHAVDCLVTENRPDFADFPALNLLSCDEAALALD